MKNLLLLICAFAANALHAQNISGIYSGKLVNDSTRKEQQYELALSEYRGQITGYSYTTFIVNDTFYYSVKRVKAERNNGVLEVEDVKMLGNNFPRQPDKGVRQVMRIPLDDRDSIAELKGSWKTTQTKTFYSIGGGLDMRRENDSSRSALVAHLYDLGEWKKPVYQEPAAVAVAPTPAVAEKPATAKNKNTKPIVEKPAASEAAAKENTVKAPVVKEVARPTVPAVLAFNERKVQTAQTFSIASDSLVLSFYDNGIVDGDTISVYLNEVNIVSKVKLTAAAAKQTIKLDSNTEMYRLILVAENLGTIPPNTGLLVIQDGNNRYQVNFTADLQTNAAIEFRRSKTR